MKEVYIAAAKRTAVASFGGALSSLSATQLGAAAIKAAVQQAGIKPDEVQEVIMGNVMSAGVGQAPARQAAKFAGLPNSVICTTVNKVCASGMKAIMIAAQNIMLGEAEVIVAGGMESMTNVPYYLMQARNGYRLGHSELIDGLIKDGLWDVYNNFHMGNATEGCAKNENISREDQDRYAVESYQRAQKAVNEGKFTLEITPVEIPQRNADPIIFDKDEEPFKVKYDKIPTLKPAFDKNGTITAANASKLNDGASAVVLMSKEKADALGVKPLAKIIAFADAERAPEEFPLAPVNATQKLLQKTGKTVQDIDLFEVNEAFSAVAIAYMKNLNVPHEKTNIWGGAVALGHPLGSSGSRICVTLIHALRDTGKKLGVAAICNGGGGASAIMIEVV
ncbi:MAG: acetyl-CoA C-acyltransferase [Bacteroidia bacterium]|nr:acetyl-CoA C-acyltransferase [Bacteroidia bacterium]MDW8346212.1 acetyl-CoA C-acyltransferase [Bacteroidia bacterium]